MRNWILLAFIMLSFVMLGQKNIKIKKKYLGKYSGVIPAYTVLEKDKNDYTIEVRTEGEEYVEKLELKGKDKKLIREGLFPQPKSTLLKD